MGDRLVHFNSVYWSSARWVLVRAPYSDQFLDMLKESMPSRERIYSSSLRAWMIHASQGDTLLRILEKVFGKDKICPKCPDGCYQWNALEQLLGEHEATTPEPVWPETKDPEEQAQRAVWREQWERERDMRKAAREARQREQAERAARAEQVRQEAQERSERVRREVEERLRKAREAEERARRDRATRNFQEEIRRKVEEAQREAESYASHSRGYKRSPFGFDYETDFRPPPKDPWWDFDEVFAKAVRDAKAKKEAHAYRKPPPPPSSTSGLYSKRGSGDYLTAARVLGVELSITPDELKRTYRTLLLKVHPDRGGSHDKVVEVNAAYEIMVAYVERRSSHAPY